MGCGVKCKKVVLATFGPGEGRFQGHKGGRFKRHKTKRGRPYFDKLGLASFLKNP
jgi:hypothetical protein